jgi:hypothetical protein
LHDGTFFNIEFHKFAMCCSILLRCLGRSVGIHDLVYYIRVGILRSHLRKV